MVKKFVTALVFLLVGLSSVMLGAPAAHAMVLGSEGGGSNGSGCGDCSDGGTWR